MVDLNPRASMYKRYRTIRDGGLFKVIGLTNMPAVLTIIIPGNLTLFWVILKNSVK